MVALPHELLGHMSVVPSIRLQGFTTVSPLFLFVFPTLFHAFHGVVPSVNTL